MDGIENDGDNNNDYDALDELLDTTVLPTKCTKNDVILGRGRAINNWPGNVQFRRLAMKYRDEYSQANRYQKVEVALLLMDEIVAMGGRFVRVAEDGSQNKIYKGGNDNDFECYEVDEARAIEKTCQALRDRHYNKPEKILPRNALPSNIRDVVTTDHKHLKELTTTKMKANHATTHAQSNRYTRRRHYRYQNLPWTTDDMLQRLKMFQAMYHHTCVPPDWKHDVVLADWCTIQRQLYRQFQSKYHYSRHLHPSEKANEYDQSQIQLFDTLQTMNFCWDYDEWHWNYWWGQVVAVQGNETDLDHSIRDWLRQQQRHYRNGTMSKSRSEKMKAAGYLPT